MHRPYLPELLLACALVFLGGCDDDNEKKTKTVAGYEVAFEDDFARADGELGADWIVDATVSQPAIAAERVQVSSPDGSPKAFYTEAVAEGIDQRVSMDVFIEGGDIAGADSPILLIARAINTDLDSVGEDVFVCGIIANQILIGTVVDGDLAIVEQGADIISTSDGDAYGITFTLEGAEMTCNVGSQDGATEYEITTEDDKLDGGYAGFIAGDINPVLFLDDFLLETRE